MVNGVQLVFSVLMSLMLVKTLAYYNEDISPFRQFIIIHSRIYIGGEGGIVALDSENMTECVVNKEYKNNWLLIRDGIDLVQCNQNDNKVSYCRKLDYDLKFTGNISTEMDVNITNLPVYSFVHLPQDQGDVLTIGATSLNVMGISFGIAAFEIPNLKPFHTNRFEIGPLNIEISGNYSIVFKSQLVHGSFIYFFFQIVDHHGNYYSSRIGKMCSNFTLENTFSGYNHSYEDMKLQCNYSNTVYEEIEYGILKDNGIIVAFSNNNDSVLCFYSFEEIHEAFNASRSKGLVCGQRPDDSNIFQPKTYIGNGHEYCIANESCQKASDVCKELYGNFCNTNYHHTITGGEGIVKDAAVYVPKKITCMSTIHIAENKSYLLIGTDDGSIGRLVRYGRACDMYNDFLDRSKFLSQKLLTGLFSANSRHHNFTDGYGESFSILNNENRWKSLLFIR